MKNLSRLVTCDMKSTPLYLSIVRPLSIKAVMSTLLLVFCTEAKAEERVTIGTFAGAKSIDPELALGTIAGKQPDPAIGSLAFGLRVGFQFSIHLRTESELAFQPTQSKFSDSDLTILAWRSHLHYAPFPTQRMRPFFLAGAGLLHLSPARVDLLQQDLDLAGHAGFGLEFDVNPSVALRMEMRTEFAPARNSAVAVNLAVFAGATFYFPQDAGELPPDADRDGVFDDVDQCLSEVEDQDGYNDEDGCPDLDNDLDGIPDTVDLCPSDAEDTGAGEKPDGCPASL